jgi:hypothetical protein
MDVAFFPSILQTIHPSIHTADHLALKRSAGAGNVPIDVAGFVIVKGVIFYVRRHTLVSVSMYLQSLHAALEVCQAGQVMLC